MSPIVQQIITLIVSVLALGCSLTIVYLTYKRDNKSNNTKDTSKEVYIAENFKELNVKLDFQSKQLDRLSESLEESTKQFTDLNSKTIKITEQIAALFNYKDEHEERLRELEKKIK